MTLYTYNEALKKYGSRSAVLTQVSDGRLFNIARNLYSASPHADSLVSAMKLYPEAIVTGLTAFYIHGLTDKVPIEIDLATRRNTTRISNPEVKQHFVDNSRLNVGATTIDYDGTNVRVYDLEMMLFYLVQHDDKLPFDLYKEVVKSYRRYADKLNYSKLQEYSEILPWGRKHLERIIKEVL
ncbi:MAG: hypothetical protein FWD72_03815 [Eggerthellaceae bacterium]|nr:hypothetical protein [Eggerthellaceae bacterium]